MVDDPLLRLTASEKDVLARAAKAGTDNWHNDCYNGRKRIPVESLQALGLIEADFKFHVDAEGASRWIIRVKATDKGMQVASTLKTVRKSRCRQAARQ